MPRRAPNFRPHSRLPKRRDESKKERDKFYSSARWMDLRLAFLDANPICELCLAKDLITPATIAHHVVERLDDESRALDPSNLKPLCNACHTGLHRPGRRARGG